MRCKQWARKAGQYHNLKPLPKLTVTPEKTIVEEQEPTMSLEDALIAIENLKKQKDHLKETFADWVMKVHNLKKELAELNQKYEELEEKYNKVKNNE